MKVAHVTLKGVLSPPMEANGFLRVKIPLAHIRAREER